MEKKQSLISTTIILQSLGRAESRGSPLCTGPITCICALMALRSCNNLHLADHMEPDRRYQWRVLPQGMANSPTICQLYVGKALQPVRDGFPSLKICHYMDDIVVPGLIVFVLIL